MYNLIFMIFAKKKELSMSILCSSMCSIIDSDKVYDISDFLKKLTKNHIEKDEKGEKEEEKEEGNWIVNRERVAAEIKLYFYDRIQ